MMHVSKPRLERRWWSTPVVVAALVGAWGLAFPIMKIALNHTTPDVVAVGRASIAALALLPLARRRAPSTTDRRRFHALSAVMGAFNVAGFFAFQSWGVERIPAGLAAILLYSQPLVLALGARAWLKEPLGRRRFAGLLCGWGGIALALWGAARADAFGVISALIAAVSWAAGSLVFKRISSNVPLLPLVFWQNVYGLLPLIALWMLSGLKVPLDDPVVIGCLAYLGLVATAGGFTLLFVLLRRGDAAFVGARIFAVPVVGAFLSVVLLGEALTGGLVLGSVGVALGIWLVNRDDQQPAVAAGSLA